MHKHFYAITALAWGLMLGLLGNWPAAAADLQPILRLKAPVRAVLYNGCGGFVGIGTFLEADKAGVTAVDGTSLTTYAAGGSAFGTVGYQCGTGTTWYGAEVMASWQNITSSGFQPVLLGGGINSHVGVTERFMYGSDGILTALSNALSLVNFGAIFPAFPVPPPGSIGATHPYLFVAAHEDQIGLAFGLVESRVWRVRAGLGVGLQQQISPSVVLDLWTEYLIPGTGITINGPPGAASVAAGNMGGGVRTGSTLKF